jgi:hypothetical protein
MPRLGVQWAAKLGLSNLDLFIGQEERTVLRDGVWGSFVVDEEDDRDEPIIDWTWSTYARQYVRVTNDRVVLKNLLDPDHFDTFTLSSVTAKLEDFYLYLRKSAQVPSVTVVDHLGKMLRMHLGEVGRLSLDRTDAFELFLGLLLTTESGTERLSDSLEGSFRDFQRVRDHLQAHSAYAARFRQELAFSKDAGRKLYPELAIRHASGVLFQSAHHIVESDNQGSLIGLPSPKSIRGSDLHGVHYTPVSLARILVALTLKGAADRSFLRVLDPTCGSGVFLTETLHELNRRGFRGHLHLIGIDISQTAISAARFSVTQLIKSGFVNGWEILDHMPSRVPLAPHLQGTARTGFRCTASIFCGNALELLADLDAVDIVVMNPPFASWENQTEEEQAWLKEHLGQNYSRRPDLSMGFVSAAFSRVVPGGRLACVLPVGVMTGDSGRKWRKELSDYRLLFDGILADHQLFEEATVSVGTVAFEKRADADERTTLFWSDNKQSSSDDGLRYLKRTIELPTPVAKISDSWGVYGMAQRSLCGNGSWRVPSGRLTLILEQITRQTKNTLKEMFAIRLGIRTGNRSAFVVDRAFVRKLSEKERRFVRPVAEGSNIKGGKVVSEMFVIMLPSTLEETFLQTEVPHLFRHLTSFRPSLEKRVSVPKSAWWTLSRMRDLHENKEPRIVSKVFFKQDGFAADFDGRYSVLTGFSWIPYWNKFGRAAKETDFQVRLIKFLINVLDSDVFYVLAREFSSMVSGGQVDLAPSCIYAIPFPSFVERIKVDRLKDSFEAMSLLPELLDGEYMSRAERNFLAAAYFGIPLEEWPLSVS